ncbi:LPP20 family lipoprotein [Sulfurimonas sp. CS5]|uniref:LPP20 family lipoprotein n=1 Tax=Sulfurimonas sp. CS5 TaxID=3391145 RepID=UPI0039EA38A6
MMKIFITILTLVLLFVSGCSTQKRIVAKKQELPSWFSNPQKSTSTMLYATGEGKNREEAIKDALNMMVSTLGVSIASEFDSKVVENSGDIDAYEQTTSSEIRSSVKKIKVSNYKLLQSKEFSFNRHLVLIESDKKKLFDSLKKELDQKFLIIERGENNLSNNIIEKFRVCKDAKNLLVDTPNTLIIMNALQNSFDSVDYVEKLQGVNNDYEKILSSISFSIESNKDAKDLEPVISSGLSAKKLQILTQKEELSTHLIIKINSKIKKANAYGFILARAAISIEVKDYKGTIIGSNKLNIDGQSTHGYSDAKENVAMKLHALVEKDGIEKVIGLSL